MTAPIWDNFIVGGWGGSNTHNVTYSISSSIRSDELFTLFISYEQSNTTPNDVTSVIDNSFGMTFTRIAKFSMIGASDGNGGGVGYIALEIWTAVGTVTGASGNFDINTSLNVDHGNVVGLTFHGQDPTDHFDLNASLLQAYTNTTPAAAPTEIISTDTANTVIVSMVATNSNQDAGSPTFGGAAADNSFSSQFSSGGAFFSAVRVAYKAFTTQQTSQTVLYPNSRTNQLMAVLAVTADSQGSSPTIANGDTVTETMSLLAGSASSSVSAPGDIVLQTMSLIPGTAGDTSALDGSKILEFTGHLIADPSRYQNDDYDSIYSIGDRIQSGLFTSGRHFPGTVVVFGTENQNWDNSYSGNGFLIHDGGSPIPAGSGFWFNTGTNDIDLRGFKLLGADTTDDGRNTDPWVIKPGFGPTQVIDVSYAANFNAFVPTQSSSTLDPITGENASVYDIVPQAPISYPHYEFQLQNSGRINTDRWCNEMHLKIAHSTLDGGDRRPGHAAPSKTVLITLGSGIVFRNDAPSHFIDPQDSWFDGDNYYGAATSHTLTQGQIGETLASTQITTVGKYLQFQFPRKVMMKHLVVQLSNGEEEYDSGGDPTVLGAWHWEVSNNGTTFETLAGTWKFNEGSRYALAPGQAPFNTAALGDQDGYAYWRMVLDGGSAFGGGNSVNQIMFDLVDKAELQPTLSILFTDDVDNIPPTVSIGAAGSPFTVVFTDNTGDGLSYTLSVIINPLLSVTFTDEGDFEPLGDFYPATYVQTLLMVTGRK